MGTPKHVPTGTRFGNAAVIGAAGSYVAPSGKYTMAKWECRCDCGTIFVATGAALRSGQTDSCGCLKAKRAAIAATRHGGKGTPEYGVWKSMRQRCTDPACKSYPLYGGRGISVCARWADFSTFLADMGSRPAAGYSIERVDNSGGYTPDNCVWATATDQAKNRRTTVWTEIDGLRVTQSEAALLLGVSEQTVGRRIAAGVLPRGAK